MSAGADTNPAGRSLLITGATGFLGSHFLLSCAKRFDRVVAIVRAPDADAARQRVLEKLEAAARHRPIPFLAAAWDERLRVVVGDVADPDCGVDVAAVRAALGDQPVELWHFAASLQFEPRHRERVEQINVEGTRHVLSLLDRIGARRLVYVSTAFVAGKAIGAIPEQLMPEEGDFNNVYEESKCRAEWLVARHCNARGADWRILRPAIVVGPLRSHSTGGSDSGLYGFVKLVHRMQDSLRALPEGTILIGQPGTPVHLTPIDTFCADADHLLQEDPGAQRVFHSVAPGSVLGGELAAMVSEALGLPTLRVEPRRPGTASPIEQVLDRVMALYGVAVRYPKTFQRACPTPDFIRSEDARAYIRECLRELRGAADAVLWRTESMLSYDGTPLCTYAAGDASRPCVVLINAFGMTVEFWKTIAEALRDEYFVVTWDSRGIPSFAERFPEDACDVSAHARDLEAVLRHYRVADAHVVGWCTGAQVALRFRALWPTRVRSLALLNGAFSFPESVGATEFKRNIMYLMPRVAESRAHAAAYHRMLYGHKGAGERAGEAALADTERARVENALLASDQLVTNLTSAPFKDPESLYRYAKLVMHLVREPEHVWAGDVVEPVLILSGAHDNVAHPAESRELARRIPHAELVVGDSWDHFSLLHEPELARRVRGFIAAVAQPERGGASRVRATSAD